MSMINRGVSSARQESMVYVGNLDLQCTEATLFELFSQIAPVVDVKMPKDRVLRTHQGYGFVELRTLKDAEYAQQIFDGLMLYNKPIRVRRSTPRATGGGGPSDRQANNSKSSVIGVGAILFISGLHKLVDGKMLNDIFSRFGTLVELPKILRDDVTNESKGNAIVSYTTFEASDSAIEEMNGKLVMNQPIKVDYSYKQDSKKREKHGSAAERLLAKNAKENDYLADNKPKNRNNTNDSSGEQRRVKRPRTDNFNQEARSYRGGSQNSGGNENANRHRNNRGGAGYGNSH